MFIVLFLLSLLMKEKQDQNIYLNIEGTQIIYDMLWSNKG